MRLVLILLLLAGTAVAGDLTWLIPDSLTPEIALRSPSTGDVTDNFYGIDIFYPGILIHIEQERESGLKFTNYQIKSSHEYGLWQYESSTRRSQARDINRQKAAARHKLLFFNAGVAATAESYDTKYTKGLLDFNIPLGKKSYVGYATNLNGLEIWDIVLEIGTKGRIDPIIKGKFYKVGRELDWEVSFSRKVNFK